MITGPATAASGGKEPQLLVLWRHPDRQGSQPSQTVQITWTSQLLTITLPIHHFLIAMDDPANYGNVYC
jgi:hypothetical protein